MKKIIIIVMFALTIPRFVPAQGTTFLSSLSQTSTGGHILGNDSWLAAEFESGNNAGGYLLNSIQLGMMDASGNPTDFLVMIYANDGNHSGENPGSSLGTLNGSSNPITAGIYAYSSDSSITLSPNTFYYIVLTSGTAIPNGTYDWNTSAYPPSGSGNWFLSNAVLYSPDGVSNWQPTTYSGIAQLAINATSVPEPSAEMLLGFGGILLLGFGSWKANAV